MNISDISGFHVSWYNIDILNSKVTIYAYNASKPLEDKVTVVLYGVKKIEILRQSPEDEWNFIEISNMHTENVNGILIVNIEMWNSDMNIECANIVVT